MSKLRTRALVLTTLIGCSHSGWSQNPPAPLPELASTAPDAMLAPSAPPDALDPTQPTLPALPMQAPVQEPAPINLSPVRGLEPAPEPTRSDLPKWRFHLGLDTAVTYDDNIFIQPTQRQADVYFGVTPIIATGWGTFLSDPTTLTGTSRFPQVADRETLGNAFYFRYAPTAVFFADHTDQNAFNEDARVAGRWISGRVNLEGEAGFQTLSAPNIDVGNRINSQASNGILNLNYEMTERTSLDSRFSLEHDSYQGGLNSTDTSLSTILNYQALPKTMVGVGGAFGYTTAQGGGDQYYEQGLIHLRYLPTYKITLDLVGGMEARQVDAGPHRVTPVFDFEATYAALDSTSVNLKFTRRTDTSALYDGQDIEETTVEASVRQRLFQKLYITVSGGVQRADYVDAGASASRNDTYSYFGVESAVEVTKWLSMKAGYHFQNDDSSLAEFGFHRNLADFQFNLQF